MGYLGNGDFEVIDDEKVIFLVKERKSYLRKGGALWFDALIDRDGNILEIVTPEAGDNTRCMSADELNKQSYVDLSRVSDRQGRVCFRQ